MTKKNSPELFPKYSEKCDLKKIENRGKLNLKRIATDISPEGSNSNKPLLAFFIKHKELSTSDNKIRICKFSKEKNEYIRVADENIKVWDTSKELLAISEDTLKGKAAFNLYYWVEIVSVVNKKQFSSKRLKMVLVKENFGRVKSK